MVKTRCWEWHIDACGSMLFGDCPECGDIISAVLPSGDFVGLTEVSCQRINEVDGSVPDGCGWRCQVYVDVPQRKVSMMWEICSSVMRG
ncbi:hypothetical protein ES708_18489 [subsurface metagenome]